MSFISALRFTLRAYPGERRARLGLRLCDLTLCGLMLLWGCVEPPTSTPKAAPNAAAPSPLSSGRSSGRVLARVGSEQITELDLERRLARLPAVTRRSYEPPERRRELLESMIRFKLLAQRAQSQGLERGLSAKLAFARALTEATLARKAHSGLKTTPKHGAQESREALYEQEIEEVELLFLATELQQTHSAEPSRIAPLATPPHDEEPP